MILRVKLKLGVEVLHSARCIHEPLLTRTLNWNCRSAADAKAQKAPTLVGAVLKIEFYATAWRHHSSFIRY
jgi:hypothetical protein